MRREDLDFLFAECRAQFAAVFPRLDRAYLVVVQRPHPSPGPGAPRDFADADPATLTIRLAQRALRLPIANLTGLLLHEFGHLATPGGSEHDADEAARRATGRAVRYDARGVQTTGRGGPRPRDLPR